MDEHNKVVMTAESDLLMVMITKAECANSVCRNGMGMRSLDSSSLVPSHTHNPGHNVCGCGVYTLLAALGYLSQ